MEAYAALAANIETSGTDYVLQYGIVGVLAVAFAYVIVFLFKRGDARDAKTALEREEWVRKEASMRGEYEAKHATLLVEYAKQLQAQREASQTREDTIRKEFADLMEHIAEEATKTSAATTAVLHKFYDRILGPNAR